MQLSKKTDYALRVLFTLAEHYGRGPIPIRELARRNDVPKRFLEHILLDCKSQNWVSSTAGKEGGYSLAKKPSNISMGEVVRYFDGFLAPIPCVSVKSYIPCTQESVCRFRRVLLEIRNYVAKIMDQASIAKVMLGSPVLPSELLSFQCVDGDGI
ncbi:MAG: Rrf2 family transcriptional regulator [Verrucomicrobia bacterium]|nr:Rrf2 family transcriptional regulator [Verrucomicrobiota bacterium]